MMNAELQELLRNEWRAFKAPPSANLRAIERECGRAAFLTFADVAPMSVDTQCPGFEAATPLFDLAPRDAACYLGTFLIALLESLDYQQQTGLHDDIFTRPHTLSFLMDDNTGALIREQLSPSQAHAVREVVKFLVSNAELLYLAVDEVKSLVKLSLDR